MPTGTQPTGQVGCRQTSGYTKIHTEPIKHLHYEGVLNATTDNLAKFLAIVFRFDYGAEENTELYL